MKDTVHQFIELSLRDYFAGQALIGLLASHNYTVDPIHQSTRDANLEKITYQIADRMLKVRDQ
jgi:hypothetical protein